MTNKPLWRVTNKEWFHVECSFDFLRCDSRSRWPSLRLIRSWGRGVSTVASEPEQSYRNSYLGSKGMLLYWLDEGKSRSLSSI